MKPNYPFKPLKKVRLYEEVAEQIKESIFDGQLKPGTPLPSERELSGMFNVGRPTVREALRTLNVLGLIEMNQIEKGYIVRDHDVAQYMENMGEQLSWMLKPDRQTLADLWVVRKYLELGISHMVARNATEEDLADLEEMMQQMASVVDDFDAYFPFATDFHKKLALITGNKFFYIIWSMVQDIMLKGYTPILGELFPEGAKRLYEVNRLVLDAIRSKDPDKINEAMEIHAVAEAAFHHHNEKGEEA